MTDCSKLASLTALGFDEARAEEALRVNGGDVNLAAESLVISATTATGASTQRVTAQGSALPNNQMSIDATAYPSHTATHAPAYQTAAAAGPGARASTSKKVHYVSFKHDRRGACYWTLNLLWIVLGGWHMFLTWFTTGAILCLTCILFPCGWQVLKISVFLLFPFGLTLVDSTDEIVDDGHRCCARGCNCLFNTVWAVTAGWILALQSIITGVVLCLTIIGIPFGLSCFQMAWLCFRPFGMTFTAEELEVVAITTDGVDDGAGYHAMHGRQVQPALVPAVVA